MSRPLGKKKVEGIRAYLLGDLTEHEHHLTFMQWVHLHPRLKEILFHIENERKCTHAQGTMRKKLGVISGVSDFFLPLVTDKHAGLWLELKRIKDYDISPAQEKWITTMRANGYQAVFVFGYEQAILTVKSYLDEYNAHMAKLDKNFRPLKTNT